MAFIWTMFAQCTTWKHCLTAFIWIVTHVNKMNSYSQVAGHKIWLCGCCVKRLNLQLNWNNISLCYICLSKNAVWYLFFYLLVSSRLVSSRWVFCQLAFSQLAFCQLASCQPVSCLFASSQSQIELLVGDRLWPEENKPQININNISFWSVVFVYRVFNEYTSSPSFLWADRQQGVIKILYYPSLWTVLEEYHNWIPTAKIAAYIDYKTRISLTLSTVMVLPCNSVRWRCDIHLAASSLVDMVTSPKHWAPGAFEFVTILAPTTWEPTIINQIF